MLKNHFVDYWGFTTLTNVNNTIPSLFNEIVI